MPKSKTNKEKPGPKEERLIIEGDPDEALRRLLEQDRKRKKKRKSND